MILKYKIVKKTLSIRLKYVAEMQCAICYVKYFASKFKCY